MTERSAESIFGQAVEIQSDEDRAAFLNRACGGDEQLRADVEKLVADHFRAGSFLEQPAINGEATAAMPPGIEQVGSHIGPYKLLQVIGEGGMGVVFMAEQVAPVQRRVALKIIKPGMASPQVLARFEAERQALALMDHPNIARVFDAGTTEHGHPYFVMELVNGLPVTNYCDEKRLTPSERLTLFVPICQAVQHAHQKGIIHRDLKPSNVLVAQYDSKPVPKVIDFGVAKATSQKLTERTLFTQFGQIVGTLEYMSPEQAERNQLDIDTRSDIYSLGVLLYELLTGETPFDRERLRSAAFAEILRIIREEQPPKPSTKISTLGRTATSTAASRNTSPDNLRRTVSGDLDWIAMKALEKERSRRYQTAERFAADIQRCLNGEAIEARPPSLIYRFNKTVQRHRSGFAVTGIFIVALVALTFWSIAARNKTRATLRRLHDELVEKTILNSLSGDDQGTERALRLAEAADIPDTTLDLLRGIASYHLGKNDEAVEYLLGVLKRDNGNVLAHAQLAIAYVHTGEWNKSVREMLSIQQNTDNIVHKDYERLLVGYAMLYFNTQQSLDILEPLVERHPTWAVARSIQGGALAHRALELGRRDMAERALHEATLAFELLPRNRLVAMFNLWVHHVNVYFAMQQDDSYEALRHDAMQIADYLKDNHADYEVGAANRAYFYETIGDFDAAVDVWLDLVNSKGNGIWLHTCVPMLVQMGRHEEALAMLDNMVLECPSLKAAKGYLIAGVPTRRAEAERICDELIAQADPYDASLTGIEIRCLLGKRNQIRMDAKKMLAAFSGDNSANWIPRTCLRFHAEEIDLNQFDAACQGDRCERMVFHYHAALRSLLNRQSRAARQHFQDCINTGQLSWGYYHWAKAFLRLLDDNPQWPRERGSELTP